MAIPLELSFRNFDRSEFIENTVKDRCRRLETLCDEIMQCHVVLSAPNPQRVKKIRYEIHVDLRVPGTALTVTKNTGESESQEGFYSALREAFDVLERQVTQWKEKRRHDVKAHSRPAVPQASDDP
jgi:ribosomal subunit interface protein